MSASEADSYLSIMQSLGFRPDLVEPSKFVAGPLRFGVSGAASVDLCSATNNMRDQALALAFGSGANPLAKVQIEAIRIQVHDEDLTAQNIYDELVNGYIEHSDGNNRKRLAFSPAWVGFGVETMFPPLAAGVQAERNGYRSGILKLPIPWIVDFSADQLNIVQNNNKPAIVEIYGAAWPREITPAWEDQLPVGVLRSMTTGDGYPLPTK
jgi:hypothetical protein